MGMPHRGRLNLLVDLFELPPEVLFYKVKIHQIYFLYDDDDDDAFD